MSSPVSNATAANLPTLVNERRARLEVDRMAARWAAAMCGVQALMIVAFSLLGLGAPDNQALLPWRLALAGLMALIGLMCWGLSRSLRPRWGLALMLCLMLMGLHGMAWGSRMGLQSLPLAAACLLLALAGGVLGTRVCVLLTLGHLAGLGAIYLAHAQGLMVPMSAMQRTPLSMLQAQTIVALSGLLAGWMLLRLFALGLQRTLGEVRRLSELLRIGADWTYTLDTRGAVREISPSFEQHTGLPAEVFSRLGQPGGPRMMDDEHSLQLRAALKARQAFRNLAVHYARPDGGVLSIRVSGEPLHDEAGVFIGWWGTCRNVSAELAASRELARAKALLERLINGTPDAIVVAYLDDGRILMVNEGFTRLSGVGADEALGRTALGLGIWPDTADQLALREQLLREGVVRNHRSELHCRDGRRRQVLINAGHFLWDERPAVTFSGRDVTEQLQAEAELAAARVQAESASRAKSAFLATMSHEIRTPLNGVLGLAHLLRDEPAGPSPRREELLGLLVQSAEGLSGIVSDVLDLSRIEAGQLTLTQAPLELAALARSAFGGFEVLGRERGLTMTLQLDPTLPAWVLGDAVRLRQVLTNLLHNALKFTDQGEVRLGLFLDSPQGLRIDVSDTGIGIPVEAQSRLFRPFAQADGSTTRRFGGSGLGLSICAELCTLMGGGITLHSDGRRGSVFTVRLPLTAAEPPTALTTPQAEALAGMRVLVAEDNPVNMLIIRALLEQLGAEVLSAQDGAEAVTLAQQQAETLDAVLMDLHMPVLDGLDATRRLAADARTAALPVIALSAAVLGSDRAQARAAGMRDFVAKPVRSADLLRALHPWR